MTGAGDQSGDLAVQCGAGEIATGGGSEFGYGIPSYPINAYGYPPQDGSSATGWAVTTGNATVTVFVLCAHPATAPTSLPTASPTYSPSDQPTD